MVSVHYLTNGCSDLSENLATDAYGHGPELIRFRVGSVSYFFLQNLLKNAFFTKLRVSIIIELELNYKCCFDICKCTKPYQALNLKI